MNDNYEKISRELQAMGYEAQTKLVHYILTRLTKAWHNGYRQCIEDDVQCRLEEAEDE